MPVNPDLAFSSLIGMTMDKTECLLLVCGLSKRWVSTKSQKGDAGGEIQEFLVKPEVHAWEVFAIEQNLKQEYFYFDRYKVKEYTGDQKVYWIGIGSSRAKPSVNPKSQFEIHKTPPRLSGKESNA